MHPQTVTQNETFFLSHCFGQMFDPSNKKKEVPLQAEKTPLQPVACGIISLSLKAPWSSFDGNCIIVEPLQPHPVFLDASSD